MYRTNRATYWLMLAMLVGLLVLFELFLPPRTSHGAYLLTIAALGRLHDLGRSAWQAAVPGATATVAEMLYPDHLILAAIAGAAYLAMLIALGVIPGMPGRNAWGEPPGPGTNRRA
jgi:uncharacterized membrane protein YhaH (DUF805 family)